MCIKSSIELIKLYDDYTLLKYPFLRNSYMKTSHTLRDKTIENYFQYFLLLCFLILFIYLIHPFIFVILFALAIVISSYPLYQKTLNIIRKPILTASLMLIFLSIIFILPTVMVSLKLYNSVQSYSNSDFIENDLELLNNCDTDVCYRIEQNIKIVSELVSDVLSNISKYFQEYFYSILSSLTNFSVHLFIFYVCLFYFYLDKENFTTTLKKLLPLKAQYKESLLEKFKRVCSAVFLDTLLIACMQGILVGIGFYLFGVKGAIIWGVISIFLSLLPFIGSALVWIPASVFLLLSGNIFAGVGLFLYGAIIVSLSDNLVRPLLLEKSIHVHPFLILLSLMGGLQIFGFVGLFYGPIIISMLVALIDLFDFEFK